MCDEERRSQTAPGGKTLHRGLWSAGTRLHSARLLKKIISLQLYSKHCEIIPALEAPEPERFISLLLVEPNLTHRAPYPLWCR